MIGFVNQFLNLISMHHKLHNIVHTVSSSMHTLHSVAMVPSRAHILQERLGGIHIPRVQILGNFDPPPPIVVKHGHLAIWPTPYKNKWSFQKLFQKFPEKSS